MVINYQHPQVIYFAACLQVLPLSSRMPNFSNYHYMRIKLSIRNYFYREKSKILKLKKVYFIMDLINIDKQASTAVPEIKTPASKAQKHLI